MSLIRGGLRQCSQAHEPSTLLHKFRHSEIRSRDLELTTRELGLSVATSGQTLPSILRSRPSAKNQSSIFKPWRGFSSQYGGDGGDLTSTQGGAGRLRVKIDFWVHFGRFCDGFSNFISTVIVVVVVAVAVQEVALSRPALCEVIPFARGHGDKHILALWS